MQDLLRMRLYVCTYVCKITCVFVCDYVHVPKVTCKLSQYKVSVYSTQYIDTYIIVLPDKNGVLVSGCDATHCNKAKALHTLLDCCAYKPVLT